MGPDGIPGDWAKKVQKKGQNPKEMIAPAHRAELLQIGMHLILAEKTYRPHNLSQFGEKQADGIENKLRAVLGFNLKGTAHSHRPVGERLYTQTVIQRFRNPERCPQEQGPVHPKSIYDKVDIQLWTEIQNAIEDKLRELGYHVDAAIAQWADTPLQSANGKGRNSH